MPYYLHPKNRPIDADHPADWTTPNFCTRAKAYTALEGSENKSELTVSFVASEDERVSWREREESRFSDCQYIDVPWRYESWYSEDFHDRHRTHLSLSHVGLIAYTPDEEHGYQDRQIRCTPGRYLEKFAAGKLDREHIAELIATVKAFDGKYRLATTAEEIEQVYRHGPRSCMSHSTGDYETDGIHPTAVYANSDLAIAYLGTPDDVSARCVVWPAEKIHTRLYGDRALLHALLADGYHDGCLEGAMVRAIVLDDGRYVMPYIDAAEGANLNGSRFELTQSDLDYSVTQTNGTTGESTCDDDEVDEEDYDEEDYDDCGHCGRNLPASELNDNGYCDRCEDTRRYCEACDEDSWDNGETIGGTWYCDSCARERQSTCEHCSKDWYEDNLSDKDTADRKRRHVLDLCPDCSAEFYFCVDCEELYEIDLLECPSCQRPTPYRCEHTGDLLASLTTEPATTIAPASATQVPVRHIRPIAEYATYTDRNSLDTALETGRWIIAANNGNCLIDGCHRSIAAGELCYQIPGSFVYCTQCMSEFQTLATVRTADAGSLGSDAGSGRIRSGRPQTRWFMSTNQLCSGTFWYWDGSRGWYTSAEDGWELHPAHHRGNLALPHFRRVQDPRPTHCLYPSNVDAPSEVTL